MSANEILAVLRSFTIPVVLGACVLYAPANAFYLPLLFEPSSPTAAQLAQLVIRVGECDAVQVFNAQDREVSVTGNTVRVTIDGTTAISQPFCIYPNATHRVDLVLLPQGAYRLELLRNEVSTPGVIDLVATADLVVGPAPIPAASAVPTNDVWTLGVLVLLVALVGTRRWRS